jgi:hypothetical protein
MVAAILWRRQLHQLTHRASQDSSSSSSAFAWRYGCIYDISIAFAWLCINLWELSSCRNEADMLILDLVLIAVSLELDIFNQGNIRCSAENCCKLSDKLQFHYSSMWLFYRTVSENLHWHFVNHVLMISTAEGAVSARAELRIEQKLAMPRRTY